MPDNGAFGVGRKLIAGTKPLRLPRLNSRHRSLVTVFVSPGALGDALQSQPPRGPCPSVSTICSSSMTGLSRRSMSMRGGVTFAPEPQRSLLAHLPPTFRLPEKQTPKLSPSSWCASRCLLSASMRHAALRSGVWNFSDILQLSQTVVSKTEKKWRCTHGLVLTTL